jgi:hypothetical protein
MATWLESNTKTGSELTRKAIINLKSAAGQVNKFLDSTYYTAKKKLYE